MIVSNGWISVEGYRVLKIDGVQKQYSHYVWWQNTGYWPDWETKREVIHHINLIPLDDRFENLQLMTDSEHKSLHNRGEKHPMYGKSRPDQSERMKDWHETHDHPMYGKSRPEHSEFMKEWYRTHDNPMFGKTGSSNPNWINGPVCYKTYRDRIYRAKKRIAEGRGTYEDYLLIQDSGLE